LSLWVAAFTDALNWGIPFLLGLLFRKRVGHLISEGYKWLTNQFMSMELSEVRVYPPSQVRAFNWEIADDAKLSIPNFQILDVFADDIRFSVPVFGNLRLSLVKEIGSESDGEEAGEDDLSSIKVSVRTESPVRLGVREVDKLDDFDKTCQVLFAAVEKHSLVQSVRANEYYAIVDMNRLGNFTEAKIFERKDEDLGAEVTATENRLNMILTPPSKIVKAAKKYRFQ
jgi:hypothetical protein